MFPAKHLEYEHPRLQGVREYIGDLMDNNSDYHPVLLANFDQTWCKKFTPATTALAIRTDWTSMQ
eukprot:10997746-Karenia_brevis.AAC.1